MPLAGKGAVSKARAKQRRREQMDSWVGVLEENTRLIPLGKGMFAKVDADLYDYLNQWNWHVIKGYALRFDKRQRIYMHHLVLPIPDGKQTDHINRDGLDNRRKNLRPATKQQNQGNRWKCSFAKTSQFKGVHRSRNLFYASGKENGQQRYLGAFASEIDAAKAYNRWAAKHFGEFALLNPV